MARRYGPEMTVPDWRKRLVCSRCGGHDTGMGRDWRAAVKSLLTVEKRTCSKRRDLGAQPCQSEKNGLIRMG
jgi:hypothetical protein